MKAALLQLSVSEEKKQNIQNAVSFLKQCHKNNTDIAILPEMFCCPYATENFPKYAEEQYGMAWQALSQTAKECNMYIVGGSIPEKEGNHIYNTSYVFDREGNQIAKHRKMHLFDISVTGGQYFKESDTLTAGDNITVFDTEFGKIGLCICYDIRFPELFRIMVDKGANIVITPGAFNMTTGPAHWEILFRTRALDNQIYTIGVAPARDENGVYVSYANSIAVSPWGNVLTRLTEKQEIGYCDIDLDDISKVRQELPLLAHRRTDIYKLEQQIKKQKIYLAGGCFWGTEKYLQSLSGVLDTTVGYANGSTEQTCYEQVCAGSGHAETVEVIFDSNKISLSELLNEFYETIDPTCHARQGMDVGIQYRTGVYYVEPDQKEIIAQSLKELQKQYQKPVVVENLPLKHFCEAEQYHQDYLTKNPNGYCHINFEKIAKKKSRIVDETKYHKPDNETLKKMLSPLQYAVTQQNETEPPFSNLYCDENRDGIYVDITTGEPLFCSADKFQSGCGWPSFTKPIDPNTIEQYDDLSHNMIRTEVRSRCGNAHLGHVFEDGPKDKGGLRYCINSAALRFIPKQEMQKEGYGFYLKFL